MPISFLLLSAAAAQADPAIIVTAAREALPTAEAPVSSTVFDEEEIDGLDLPFAADLLRLAPGVSVASTGPRGTQTQVRIRGGEANHSLLFVDGIRFNDPAAGNEPRFELLTSNLLSRIEIVRGPQSALWGSEAPPRSLERPNMAVSTARASPAAPPCAPVTSQSVLRRGGSRATASTRSAPAASVTAMTMSPRA